MYAGKYYAVMAGGLWGSIAKVASKVVKPLVRSIPGVGLVASAVDIGSSLMPSKAKTAALPASSLNLPQGFGGAMARKANQTSMAQGYKPSAAMQKLAGAGAGLAGLGRSLGGAFAGLGAGTGRRYRRMNPLNPKAANRAIRRIKAIRKLTRSIESQLPKRTVRPASPFARKRRAA